jgi:hypothetical protein
MTTMKKRRRTQFDRSSAPIGTIRIRNSGGVNGDRPFRVIKVRMDGPSPYRWVHYAKWLWEKEHGPVPEGYRVAHLDGDMLNDDLTNLASMTPGQIAGLFHLRDPEGSADNYRKCREATAAKNVARGRENRRDNWLPTQWYAVLPGTNQYQIWNAPRRKRTAVLRMCGLNHPWRVIRSAALGFPGRDLLQACFLVSLIDLGGISIDFKSLLTVVNELRAFAGWERVTDGAARSAMSALKKDGLVSGPRRVYMLTGMHELEQERKTPLIVVRGDRLSGPEFSGFRKVDTIEGVCRRCGCVEERACVHDELGPCWWIAPDLCSHCDPKTLKAALSY